jgi:hypothetical protein
MIVSSFFVFIVEQAKVGYARFGLFTFFIYPYFGLLKVVNLNLGLKLLSAFPKLHQHEYPTSQQDIF